MLMLMMMIMVAANQQKKYQQKQQQQQQREPEGGQSAVLSGGCAEPLRASCSAECSRADQEVGKSSNSSNETVIARLDALTSSTGNISNQPISLEGDSLSQTTAYANNAHKTAPERPETTTSGEADHETMLRNSSARYEVNSARKDEDSHKRASRFKSFLLFTQYLNPFHHNQHNEELPARWRASVDEQQASRQPRGQQQHHHLALLELAQRYFGRGAQSNRSTPVHTKSAPVTPVKWQTLEGGVRANGCPAGPAPLDRAAPSPTEPCAEAGGARGEPGPACDEPKTAGESGGGLLPLRPSVRFAESQLESAGDERRKRAGRWTSSSRQNASSGQPDQSGPHRARFADQSVQTSVEAGKSGAPDADEPHHDDQVNLVDRLFALPRPGEQLELRGETPMNSSKFRQYGYSLIDYISNYLDTIDKRRVTPLNIEPGYLKSLIQPSAPERGESFASIMHDFENHIMCGITHWQHPHFHAYFPAGNAYPSILADMLSDALGCVGFSWAASPAYTELEIIMLDWMGKMIGLPDEFLCLSGNSGGQKESKGGGVIQGSASECVLVNLLAARHWAMEKLRKKHPNTPDGLLLTKLVGYCSKEAHSCVEKAAMIGFIRMRALDTDEKHSLRGETLERAVSGDLANGLEPFLVCATLGTTSCCSFDNLEELGQVCQRHDIWLQVDAAYAGSALICPEFKHLMKGIELVTSFNMNPNKWMLINFDCSLMWVKDRFKLTRAFVVDPLYLQHSFSDQAIDYRHWGIPLSRRFRALKLWFVIRNYGVEGLQAYIRNHVRLAKLFEQRIKQDQRFMITNEVVLGLVCFRLIGSNALNQRLLSMINASGKLHMVPASVNGRYVIRFCVCDQNAKEADIEYAYRCISDFATELFESIRAGKERIRAISQQNTIDVSSVSLHNQQSASADRLNSAAQPANPQQVAGQPPASPREAARQYLVMRRNSRHGTLSGEPAGEAPRWSPGGANPHEGALVKQASMVHERPQLVSGADDDEDLEQEIVLDSLATIDGLDYDLEDDEDELLEPPLFDEQEPAESEQANATAAEEPEQASPSANMEWRSPVARRWHARKPVASRASSTLAHNQRGSARSQAGAELEEAEDEVFTLAERRNRMSLRYKREFFVRVVSDPRVYRASISGDINAHASCCSLGGPQAAAQSASKATTEQQQRNQTGAGATTSAPGPIQNAASSNGR